MMKKENGKARLHSGRPGKKRKSIMPVAVPMAVSMAGMLLGALVGMLCRMEAQAGEERIQILEFGVVNGPDGISANCVYQYFDDANGMLQLYLEKADEQGTFSPLAYVDLNVAEEEAVTARTKPQRAEPGTYRAVLLEYHGEGMPLIRFRDSGQYRVEETGSAKEEAFAKSLWEEWKEPAEGGECGHLTEERIFREATPFQDEVLAKTCMLCGQVLGYTEVPNSAYVAFLRYAADEIYAAEPEGPAVILTDRWISFDRRVLEAMEGRRDVSVLLQYRYEGIEHSLYIPSGSDVSDLGDANGYCGFCYLDQIFGEKIDG